MSKHTSHLPSIARYPDRDLLVRSAYVRPVLRGEIAKRAYEKYEARGCTHGFDLQDWTDAVRELDAETLGQVTSSPSLCPSPHAS